MNRTSARPLERFPGEAWIDAIETMMNAQKDMFVNSLRWWQRLSMGAFATQADMAESSASAAKTAIDSVADATASTTKVAKAQAESLSETLTEQTRRRPVRPEPSVALDALTVEQLDRLAYVNDVEDYPHSGSKHEKVDALAAAHLSLEALSVEHLDRLAAAKNVEDYPKSASKSEKIAALEAARIGL
jgi:hypothetical protein